MAIVFVSGCFDLLHSGHIAFLEEASSYGDLYVGVASDKTIIELKGRNPIIPEEERLYMIKSIKYVKDAWINTDIGVMDFLTEIKSLKPDIFFVNTDGYSIEKEQYCKEHNIKLIVRNRTPHSNLQIRSTTALRQENHIPYRVELCGAWLDQPCVNSLYPGSVITLSIEPTIEFHDRSGMATSSRKIATELWQTRIPEGNRSALAKLLFCLENPPGTTHISGTQDHLGIMLPGCNMLHYNNGYWPDSIETIHDWTTYKWIQDHLCLIPLTPRSRDYNVYAKTNIQKQYAASLAQASEDCWKAISNQDIDMWIRATNDCYDAQIHMFPCMETPEVHTAMEKYRSPACGCKLTGAGGGGYLVLVSDQPIDNAIRITPCFSDIN